MRWREFIAGFGIAAAWPLAARAQQPVMPVIGVLVSGLTVRPPNYPSPAFVQALSERGIDGFDGGNRPPLNQFEESPAGWKKKRVMPNAGHGRHASTGTPNDSYAARSASSLVAYQSSAVKPPSGDMTKQ